MKAFTLIELLVTVAIVGILAGVALVNYEEFRKKAYYADMLSMGHNWKVAKEGYLIDHETQFNKHCKADLCNLPGMTFSKDTCTEGQYIFHNKVTDRSVMTLLPKLTWIASPYGLNFCSGSHISSF